MMHFRTPFSSLGGPNGPTERPDRTGQHKKYLIDVEGHDRRWMWTPICRAMCDMQSAKCKMQNIPFVVRTDSSGKAQDSAWTRTRFFNTRTERMTTSSLVPFRSRPRSLEGVKTRPQCTLGTIACRALRRSYQRTSVYHERPFKLIP